MIAMENSLANSEPPPSTIVVTPSDRRSPSPIPRCSKHTLRNFLQTCNRIELSKPVIVQDWLEEIRLSLERKDNDTSGIWSWPNAIFLFAVTFGIAAVITWFSTTSILTTVYMSAGISSGFLGMARRQQEITSIGGVIAKSLAWYLAPAMGNFGQIEKYVLSLGLAMFLEYPFLTFANSLALKSKTALRLRAFQDAVDVFASFIMVSVSGTGVLDAFAIAQAMLALLRVVVAALGARYCLSSSSSERAKTTASTEKERIRVLHTAIKLYQAVRTSDTPPEIDQWIVSLKRELNRFPAMTWKDHIRYHSTKGALVCLGFTVVGLTMGVCGLVATDEPYVVGIAAVFGMGLAWYLGPSFADFSYLRRWCISVFLTATLEYPFLSEANNRAARSQETFQLRAIQDLASIVISTLLITVLSRVKLNRVDFAQLAIGFLRVLVATKFFWAMQ